MYQAGKEFAQAKVKEGLASLAQSANKFMESKAGQVVKDLVKIGGGLTQMAIGANLALLSPINIIFSEKLMQEGFKNATGGMETTTGKYVGASIQAIAGAIEFGVGFGLAAGASWTGVGLAAGPALMAYGANNMIEGGTSIYNMATGKGEKGINLIRDSVFTPVFGDKWGSILYSVTDIGVGFMGPGLIAQAKNLPKLGGVLSGAKGLMTNIPQMLNGAKAGLTNFVEGVKNFPIIPETVINVGDRFVATKGKTAGDLFNFIVGKGDDAGNVSKIPTEGNSYKPDFIVTPNGVTEAVSNGQHVLERHVGLSNTDLLNRISSNPKISGASTFTDDLIADKVINIALTDFKNINRIDNWLTGGAKRNLPINFMGSDVIGRGVKQGSNTVEDMTNARIILKNNGAGGYDILTAYPVK